METKIKEEVLTEGFNQYIWTTYFDGNENSFQELMNDIEKKIDLTIQKTAKEIQEFLTKNIEEKEKDKEKYICKEDKHYAYGYTEALESVEEELKKKYLGKNNE